MFHNAYIHEEAQTFRALTKQKSLQNNEQNYFRSGGNTALLHLASDPSQSHRNVRHVHKFTIGLYANIKPNQIL